MVDVLIIGAGPAGLSAAIYAQRAGKQAVCLEALTFGGQIVNTPEIENYPGIQKISGFEFAMGLYNQATSLGAEVSYEKAVSIEDSGDVKTVKTESGKEYQAKAVIIATGAKNRHLGIDREEALTGSGVSYCATCDGAFFKGKDVAVNGGGNTALEDAIYLAGICNKVYLVHRRDAFRGEQALVDIVRQTANIELVLNSTISELKGEKKLEAITVKNTQTSGEMDISVSGLFVAIGQVPSNEPFAELVNVDPSGYIVAGEDCKTNVEGIFAAGDGRTKTLRQLTTAASDGAIAAVACCDLILHSNQN